MKEFIKHVPIIGPFLIRVKQKIFPIQRRFSDSETYWIQRYKAGANSGAGSYNKLADFKASILNDFVKQRQISSIIEFGSGDGNQLTLAEYPSYIGFDVSPEAIQQCKRIFQNDPSKTFKLLKEFDNETAELTLSLDVIYHLIEDAVFNNYMERLFDSSTRFVIVYSSNMSDSTMTNAPHVKHRRFTDWVEENRPSWQLLQQIPNRYPFRGDDREGSFADFYIFELAETAHLSKN